MVRFVLRLVFNYYITTKKAVCIDRPVDSLVPSQRYCCTATTASRVWKEVLDRVANPFEWLTTALPPYNSMGRMFIFDDGAN